MDSAAAPFQPSVYEERFDMIVKYKKKRNKLFFLGLVLIFFFFPRQTRHFTLGNRRPSYSLVVRVSAESLSLTSPPCMSAFAEVR